MCNTANKENKVYVDISMLEEVAKTLFLLGKYSNNGIDTKVSALYLSEKLNQLLTENKNV